MVLDTRSLVVASAIMTVLLGGIALFYGVRQTQRHAIRIWGICLLLGATGYVGIALRGMIPDLISIVVANTAIVACVALSFRSIRVFRGATTPDVAGWSAVASVPVVVWLASSVWPNLSVRIALTAGLMTVFLVRSAMELRRHAPEECRVSYRFTETVFWIVAAAMALSGISGALQSPVADFMEQNWLRAVPFLIFMAAITAATLGMFWIEVQYLQRDLAHLASHDTLTGLFNRKAFLDAAARELSRAERAAGVFSVAMLDLDHFKQVNDRYGHPAGDRVLRQFADTLLADIRKHDVAARVGGEEFALLMPDTDHAMAKHVVERIRADTEAQSPDTHGARIAITVSGGVATFAADGRTWDELFAAADRALYRAKAEGRNRVLSAGAGYSSGTGAGSTPGFA